MWSLIAAAFIGPGTVATAARAGSSGGLAYLVVVILAAVAGFTYMEMAARLTIRSGRSLGSLLRGSGRWLPRLLFGAVWFGCTAYQAGNLAGALGGLQLLFPVGRWLILPLVLLIGFLLYGARTGGIARVMAGIVAVMGVVFVIAASVTLFIGAPRVATVTPDGNLILGLVGTTIVPYNFFLAAGLGSGGRLTDMRWGLATSFVSGWIITSSILIVGATVPAFTSFTGLAESMTTALGPAGGPVLAIGLFCAGFSSATTAPLAAAVAAGELLGWEKGSTSYRAVWGLVLTTGAVVALLEIDIVGIILGAQIVNGLLLPLVALIVLLLANRTSLLAEQTNRWYQNLIGTAVLVYLSYRTVIFLTNLFGWG